MNGLDRKCDQVWNQIWNQAGIQLSCILEKCGLDISNQVHTEVLEQTQSQIWDRAYHETCEVGNVVRGELER